MKLAVLGATGPTGLQCLSHALNAGHTVVALVRNPQKISTEHENLKVVKVDIYNEENLTTNFAGVDAVISCLGFNPGFFGFLFTRTVTLYSDTIKPIVAAMKQANVNRFICMSSWGTEYSPDSPKLLEWIIKPLFLGPTVRNMGEMERYLMSEADPIKFTSVRAPQLTDAPFSGKSVVAVDGQFVPNVNYFIPRNDIARFMLQCVTDQLWLNKCVSIGIP